MTNLKNILTLILLSSLPTLLSAQKRGDQIQYIEQYKFIAMSEMRRAGIPASIKLAQALIESAAGTSTLTRKTNNHFGIKCGPEWDGQTYYVEDDEYNADGTKKPSCFRAFKDGEASFIAHSEFLRDTKRGRRYAFLFEYDPTDYRAWAYGLRQAGYATHPNYPEILIKIIQDYELYLYDTAPDVVANYPPSSGSIPPANAPSNNATDVVQYCNDVKFVLASEGETLADIARKQDISVGKLVDRNDAKIAISTPLTRGTKVFLQRKNRYFHGRQDVHYAKENETMFSISQMYGIRLYRLYDKNRMEEGSEPAVGERISLRGYVDKDKKTKLRNAATPTSPKDDSKSKPTNATPPSDVNSETKNSTTQKPQNSQEKKNTNAAPFENNSERIFSGKELDFDVTPQGASPKVLTSQPDANPPMKPVVKNKSEENIPQPKPKRNIPVLESSNDNTSDGTTNDTETDESSPEIDKNTPPQAEKIPTSNSAPPENTENLYIVQSGDTLFGIAKRNGISVATLKKLNNMTDDIIKLGQAVKVK